MTDYSSAVQYVVYKNIKYLTFMSFFRIKYGQNHLFTSGQQIDTFD